MTPTRLAPRDNRLLTSLPGDIADRLKGRMQLVELNAGATLYDAGAVLRHVHFPVTAVVSLVSPLQNGSSVEVAVVGREGVAGVCAFMGGGLALSSAVVQHAGRAWRMAAADIAALAQETPALMQRLLAYTQFLFTHMAQISVCHRHHSVASQLCRWLLQHADRLDETEMRITHERIAGMLGVRREGVTAAALQLQREGVISYRRGVVQVVDRGGLEDRSCECYGVVGPAFAQLHTDRAPGARQASGSMDAWANHRASPCAERNERLSG